MMIKGLLGKKKKNGNLLSRECANELSRKKDRERGQRKERKEREAIRSHRA
jgi:hypothetical protein